MTIETRTDEDLEGELAGLRARLRALEAENRALRAQRAAGRLDPVIRDALESLREGVALYDAEDRLVLFNNRYVELYHPIAARIVPGASFHDLGEASIAGGLFAGDDAAGRALFAKRAANREDRLGVIDIELADGSWRRISERRTSDGGIVSVHSDITDYVTAIRLATEASTNLYDAIEAIPQAIILYDAEGRLTHLNRQAHDFFPNSGEVLRPGNTFAGILRAMIENGDAADPVDDIDAYVAGRLSHHLRADGAPRLRTLGDGRIAEVREWRTDAGGIVAVTTDISADVEREAALREQRDKLRLVTDSLPAVVGYLDGRQRLQLFNRQGREWLGLDQGIAIGDLDIIPLLDGAGAGALVGFRDRALAGEAVSFEETLGYPDGKTRDVSITYVPDHGEDGTVRGIFSFVIDITERNQAQATLRDNETRFRDFALATSDWLWEADASFRITWASDDLLHLGGTEGIAVLGHPPWGVGEVDKVGEAAWIWARDRLMPGIPIRDIRHRVTLPGGGTREVSSSCIGLFDSEGRLVGVRGSTSDVSQAVAAGRRAIQAETRLRDALEALPVGLLWFDADDRLILRNQEVVGSAERDRLSVSLGASFETLVRDSIASGGLLDGIDDEERFVAERMAAHRDPADSFEVRLPRDRWARIREHRMADGGTLLIRIDITDLKRHQRALVEAKRNADEAKSNFLAAASHDLRQPLQALTLMLSMLSDHVEDDVASELVRDAGVTLGVMSTLLNSLLDITKLDAGLVLPAPETFRVGDLMDRLARQYRARAAAAEIRFDVVRSEALVWSDPALLERIFGNLLANALRYAPKGRVLLGCRRVAGAVRLEVWDTGIGIPERELDAVFREFHQIGNPDRSLTRGLGLGLAIVDRLSRLLNLRVSVRSAEGRGSVFAAEIPLSTNVDPIPMVIGDGDVAPERLVGLRVLLIEDDGEVRRIMTRALQGLGVEVWAAEGRAQAMAALDDLMTGQGLDLIIADYRLAGGERGSRLVAEIRDRLGHPVAASIITGDTTPEPLREIHASGCRPLYKPVGMETLKGILGQALTLRADEPA